MKRVTPSLFLSALLGLFGCHSKTDIILAGNSIPANIFGLPFEQMLASALGPTYRIKANISFSGQSTADMLNRDRPLLAAAYKGSSAPILVAWEGTNDLSMMAQAGTEQGRRAFDHTRAYFQKEKVAYSGLRTVTGTVLPRTNPQTRQPTFEAERLIYNDLLRQAVARHEPWLDALADVAAEPALLTPGPNLDGTESAYYHDWVHLNKAGLELTVARFKKSIEKMEVNNN